MKTYNGKIFQYRKSNIEKLLAYGFLLEENSYKYTTDFFDENFSLTVVVSKDDIVKTSVIENSTGEEFSLLYIDNAKGEFVGKVRENFENILSDIAQKCFDCSVFKSEYAELIINYVKTRYDTEAEYLWEKFPNNAVFREKQSEKWFGAILTASRKTLKLKGEGEIEIINLKNKPEKIQLMLENTKFLPAYHMNKKHWFTICLDGSVDIKEIYKYIKESYELVLK